MRHFKSTCGSVALLALGVLAPTSPEAQDGNWQITNGGVGSFAGWATVSGVQPLVGDFDGDDRDDVALIRRHSGWTTMPVAFSNGAGGWQITNGGVGSFAGWATVSGVVPLVGDFNGDGRDDVALIRQHSGWTTMPVAFSDGAGGWQITNGGAGSFAGWATSSLVVPLVGDFNGDGRDDIALIRQTAGWTTMPVAFSNGAGGWQITNGSVGSFAGWATSSGVRVIVGDYNNDNRDDIALLRQNAGWTTMPVAFASGGGNWTITNNPIGSFAGWATTFGVRPLVGDFTGDGRDDVALLRLAPGWGTMPLAIATTEPPITTRRLTVARYNTATGDNARVDEILRDASIVLQTNDGPGDVACPVAFARQGDMTVFNDTDGNLNTSAKLNTVFGLAPDMKIVPAVDFCGGQFNTSFIGCGIIGQFNLIIERFLLTQEGILWAHEIGHNVGLDHRTDTNDALMFRSIAANRLRINQAECNAFLSGGQPLVAGLAASETALQAAVVIETSPDVGMGLTDETIKALGSDPMMQVVLDETMVADLSLQTALEQSAGIMSQGMMADPPEEGMGLDAETAEALSDDPMMQPEVDPSMAPQEGTAAGEGQTSAIFGRTELGGPLPPVGDFVRQIYFHGLPLARAADYGPDAIPVLVEILNDPGQVLYHENAALTLGMIGETASVAPLIDFLESNVSFPTEATETERVYAGKGRVAAVVALGYAANLSGSGEAVDFLLGIVQGGLSEAAAARPANGGKLIEYAIIALGFAGSDEALGFLDSLDNSGADPSADAAVLAEGLAEAVDTSLMISREVAEIGLLEYYQKSE
jgi:hypothetical protein